MVAQKETYAAVGGSQSPRLGQQSGKMKTGCRDGNGCSRIQSSLVEFLGLWCEVPSSLSTRYSKHIYTHGKRSEQCSAALSQMHSTKHTPTSIISAQPGPTPAAPSQLFSPASCPRQQRHPQQLLPTSPPVLQLVQFSRLALSFPSTDLPPHP